MTAPTLAPAVTATHPGGDARTFTLEQVGADFASLAPVVTIPNVVLCRVGTHNAGTGPATITAEDLQAMVDARTDPDVDAAALHPGHFDSRFAARTDGEPALGWVENLRVAGDELRGDLVSVPAKFAAVMPHAYRRRSVEVARGVRTRTKVHAAVLTGLGLLGVSPPAVKGMADVLDRYSAGGPAQGLGAYVVDDTAPQVPALPATAPPGGMMGGAYYSTAPTPDQTGGPIVARLTEDQVSALAQQAGVRTRAELLAALAEPATPAAPAGPTTPPAAAPAGATTPPATPQGAPAVPAQAVSEGGVPGLSPELVAALRAAGVIPPAEPAAPATGAPAVPAQAAPAPSAPAPAAAPELVTASAAPAAPAQPPVVQLSAGTLELLQGIAARQVADDRARVITSALSAGKITPAEAPAWAAQLEAAPEAVTSLLASMAGGRVPTGQVGSALAAGTSDAVTRAFDAADAVIFGGAVPPVIPTTTPTGA